MKKISLYILFMFTLSIFYIGCSEDNPVSSKKEINPVDTGPWRKQTIGIESNLTSVRFINTNTGWAAGLLGIILKTTNGGQNWVMQQSPLLSYTQIQFLNELSGYACAMFGGFTKTLDGGNSWQDISLNTSFSLNSLYFVSVDTGWTVGDVGRIFKTEDAGHSWTFQDAHIANSLKSVFFINNSIGWVCGSGILLKTFDGGITWVAKIQNTALNFSELRFFNSSTGYVVGWDLNSEGFIAKTVNGGNTWNFKYVSGASAISFIYPDTCWVVSPGGYSFKSEDGGSIWLQSRPADSNLNSVFFVNNMTGWTVGDNGTILRTTSGGE